MSEEALAYAHTALTASQQSEDSHRIVQAQHMLAFYQVLRGDLTVAEEHLQATLAMSERTGELLMQALCLLDLVLLYRKRGQVHETRHYSLRALALPATMIITHLHIMARANLAWVAWREGNLPEVQSYARAAIELWEPLRVVFPLQWIALWPLVAVALAQDQLVEALDYARMLLSPEQQPLAEPLMTVVESAVQAWDADRRDAAYSYLQEAVALAQQMSYL